MELLIAILLLILLGASLVMIISIKRRINVAKKVPKLPSNAEEFEEPLVSVIVPFRNEEANLPSLLKSLEDQNHSNMEIVLVNDQSTDTSPKIADDFAHKHEFCKVVSTEEKPEGWVGKTWACEMGFRNAKGEWLIFTDADVQFKIGMIRRALSLAITKNLDILTLMPRILCRSIWANLIQPIFYHLLLVLYSPLRVNNPNDLFAYLFGSFFLIRKSTYIALGRHEVVKDSLIEDRAFGAIAKQKNAKLMMVDASSSFTSLWATGLADVIHGIERIASFSINVNPLRGIAFALGLFIINILPFLVIPVALLWYTQGIVFSEILLMIAAFAAALTLLATSIEVLGPLKISPIYIPAAPLGGALFAFSLLTASYKNAFKKQIVWKGRAYRPSEVRF